MTTLLRRIPRVIPALILVAAIAGCAGPRPAAPDTSATATSAAASEAPVATDSAAPESAAPDSAAPGGDVSDSTDTVLRLSVTGAAGSALIRDAVIIGDHDDPDQDATVRDLPWSGETTLTPEQAAGFVKVVLFAKNVDGSRGNLDCAVTINGETAAHESTASQKPITCLVVAHE